MEMTRESSVFVCRTVQISVNPAWAWSSLGSPTLSVHGGDIQLRGLYDPPSEWTRTLPSALSMRTLVARGRCADSRPA